MDQKKAIQVLDQLKSETKARKFNESIDLAVNFKDVDLRNPSNRFSIEVLLPNPPAKQVRVCVIADGQLALDANRQGATVLGQDDLDLLANDPKRIRKLAKEHAFFLASTSMMLNAVKVLRKLLGPRGKLPQRFDPEKDDIATRMSDLSRTIKLQLRKAPTMHTRVGTRDMDSALLAENIGMVMERLGEKLEKGDNNIKSVFAKTSMGTSYRII